MSGATDCGISVLVEKAEDLKLLVTYLRYVNTAMSNGDEMPKLVLGFNDPDVLDCFCSLCETISKNRV